MSESKIPGVPLPKRAKRKPTTTTKRWVEMGPMVPWMRSYLQWLAIQPGSELVMQGAPRGYRGGSVTTSQKTKMASMYAGRGLSKDTVRLLELRPDVIEYFGKLQADAQFKAKEMLSQDISTNIEARREGLEVARAEKDHKAIKGYTDWVPEVAFPKKAPEEGVKTSVVIHLGSKQAQHLIGKALSGEIQECEVEIIEPKQLNAGDDDGQ